MPADNKLELVVGVDVNKASASIKSIDAGLPGMGQAAGKAPRRASTGVDRIGRVARAPDHGDLRGSQ